MTHPFWILAFAGSLACAAGLQQQIDSAPAGAVVELAPGFHEGPVRITKPVTVRGVNGATIRGNGRGSVVWIQSPDVTLEHLHITGSGIDLNSDNAGVFVQADRAVISGNLIDDCLHGIYVKKAVDCQIEENEILGKEEIQPVQADLAGALRPDISESCSTQLDQNRRGNGIHLWNSQRISVRGNNIRDTRDGIYFSFTNQCSVRDNRVSHARFGLHYMYSDYNFFENNQFTENAAGSALMYSKGLLVRGNVFAANVGHRAYGIVLTAVDSSRFEGNEIRGNSIGLYLELSNLNQFVGNRIHGSYIGARLTGSSDSNKFSRNVLANNFHPVEIDSGGAGANAWSLNGRGNRWNQGSEIDLDGNGVGELPHSETDLLGSLRRPFPIAALLSGSPLLDLVRFAQQHANLPMVPAIVDPNPLTAAYKETNR